MRCRGEKLHGRRRCPTGHRQLTRSYSEGGPTLGEAERPFSDDRTRRWSGRPQGRGASRRRRGSAEPMTALPGAGMTSEREANPMRGGVRRRTLGSGPFASRCRPCLRRGQQAPRFRHCFANAVTNERPPACPGHLRVVRLQVRLYSGVFPTSYGGLAPLGEYSGTTSWASEPGECCSGGTRDGWAALWLVS
jgi:hypothetical protein